MKWVGVLCLFAGLCLEAADWNKILTPGISAIPREPLGTVVWRSNLTDSLAEAKRKDVPLLVTLRCLPCKQCSDFDKEILEGGPELDPLLKQFVTVRLTDAAIIDLRLLPLDQYQDLDLSWWAWMLSPEGQVYSVYGGKDHRSETNRISKAGFISTIKRVLEHHYDPRRRGWKIDPPVPVLSGKTETPRQLPGFASWEEKRNKAEPAACIHCHQVREILWQPMVDAKTFDKDDGFDVWPLPENAGLSLDRDAGLIVTAITPGGFAEIAGLRIGDFVAVAEGRRLFSQTDFRAVLHNAPAANATISLHWLRDGKVHAGKLYLSKGWKKTNLDWRMTVSQGNVGAYPAFFPLNVGDKRKLESGLNKNDWAIEPFMGTNTNSPAYQAGLRQNFLVTAINGESPNLAGRALLVWFRKRFDPGNEVKISYVKPNKEKGVAIYRLPLH